MVRMVHIPMDTVEMFKSDIRDGSLTVSKEDPGGFEIINLSLDGGTLRMSIPKVHTHQ